MAVTQRHRNTEDTSQHHSRHREECGTPLVGAPVTVTLDGEVAGPERESLRQATSTGLLWHGGHVAAKGVLRFLTTVVLARILLPEDFGILGMALLVNEIISLLGGLSLGVALIQRNTLDESYLDTAFWANIGVGLGLSVGFLLMAPMGGWFFHTTRVVPLIMFMAPVFFVTASGGVHKALLIRRLDFRRFAVIGMAGTVVRSVVTLGLVLTGAGIWGVVWGMLAERLTTLGALVAVVPWRPRRQFAWSKFLELFRFSRNLYGNNVVRFFSANSDFLLVGRLLGAEALGFYQFAYNLPHLVLGYFTETVSEIVFPVYCKVQDDLARFRRGYAKTVTFTSLVTFPLMAGLMVVAPEFIRAVYGAKWLPAAWPLRILCLSAAVMSVMYLTPAVLEAKGRPDIGFKWHLVLLPATVLSLLFGARWGLTGIAVTMTVLAFLSIVPMVIATSLIGLPQAAVVRALAPALTGAIAMTALIGGAKAAFASRLAALPGVAGLALLVGLGVAGYVIVVKMWWPDAAGEFQGFMRRMVAREGR